MACILIAEDYSKLSVACLMDARITNTAVPAKPFVSQDRDPIADFPVTAQALCALSDEMLDEILHRFCPSTAGTVNAEKDRVVAHARIFQSSRNTAVGLTLKGLWWLNSLFLFSFLGRSRNFLKVGTQVPEKWGGTLCIYPESGENKVIIITKRVWAFGCVISQVPVVVASQRRRCSVSGLFSRFWR